MSYNDNFQEIFDNLKDGDCLGFYKGGIFKYFIPLATGWKCNHVGSCWNVKREKDKITFNFSEQTFEGGKFDLKTIYKIDGKFITDDPYFTKQDKIYYRSLKKKLTPKQIEIAVEDAKSQIRKVYGWKTLIFGFNFWNRILPRFVLKALSNFLFESNRVCSTNVYIQFFKIGLADLNPKKDPFKDPGEILNLSLFEQPKQFSNFLKKC